MADPRHKPADRRRQPPVEPGNTSKSGQEQHPAGPHAADHLTDHKRTPGAGALPDRKEGEVDGGVG